MSSFEPDPQQQGVVEIAADPVDEVEYLEIKGERLPGFVYWLLTSLSLAQLGFPAHESISVTIHKVKQFDRQYGRFTVVISGPWYMTLAQVNQVLKENGEFYFSK